MINISENGKKALKIIFSDYLANYNSYNIRDKIGISQGGSLKLLRSLKEKGLLTSEKMGNAIFYKTNLENGYLIKLQELIYSDYSSFSSFVKGWISQLGSLAPYSKAILLFGSILMKEKAANDVDIGIILKKKEDYKKLEAMIKEINEQNRLKIHTLFLTEESFERKLKEKDKPLLDIVRSCIVIHGQDLFVKVLKNAQKV